MKTQIKIFKSFIAIVLISFFSSCNQNSIDPALVLDNELVPDGYQQVDNPSSAALARLEELRLENPKDHYYYLKINTVNASEWLFPQEDLKIEYVDYNEIAKADENPNVQGVVVKKIKGDWNEEVFMIVEGQPTPKGGMQELYQYISTNIKYPEEAKSAGIQGKVFVEFVVDQKGKLTNVQAIKGIGAGCDKEAVRVLKDAPNWVPGLVCGKSGKVRMILPITYKLS
jgi:TonB family protein